MKTELRLEILQQRVEFIQEQIESLDHYLPETYQLLMNELDMQNRMLMEQRLNQYYQREVHWTLKQSNAYKKSKLKQKVKSLAPKSFPMMMQWLTMLLNNWA